MSRSVTWIHGQRPTVAGHCFLDTAHVEQDVAQLAVAAGASWIELDGACVAGQGLAARTLVTQGVSQAVPRLRVTGVEWHLNRA